MRGLLSSGGSATAVSELLTCYSEHSHLAISPELLILQGQRR